MLYPSLTSTDKNKININFDQINKLNIDTICLFLTCLEKEERNSLYQKLKQSSIINIPFVHLRSDMDELEMEYLINNFNTKVFNIHSLKIHPLTYDLSKYKNKIFVENTLGKFDEETIKLFAGICIDFSHLEHYRITEEETYNKLISQIEKYPCKCGHVSAIKQTPFFDERIQKFHHDFHFIDKGASLNKDAPWTEIEYVFKYNKYFPQYLALELENTIEEQLEIIKYFNEKWQI